MIDLSDLRCNGATPTLLDWSALMEPALGGVTQRVGRLGARFSIEYSTPVTLIESEGRRWIARLQRAQREGGRVEFPQVDFDVGTPGMPTVDGAHTGGMALNITGASPHYGVREGQALNLTVAGRMYLYFAAETAILDAGGAGTIELTSPMRTFLSGGEAVELAKPMVEGWLDGTERSWTIDLARTVGLQFTITERA
ncbi:hypothetical protein [Novosphingobium clariflavum]|uniref:Uncharacterized protein n=1 Tax=Novosphingobium clariflavum TaxID=2029884 RepID=A0ABV6S969_9SPHN|nr:hypothetical protein [Novosphingobium clariflavum]